jgi:uroporphyrinogen-III synthase
MAPPPVLITRPRSAAEALAARLRPVAAEIVVSPLLEMAVTGPLPALDGGLILTSRNGVAAYAALEGPAGLPAWCVGPATARAAADHGLEVRGVAPNAAALAAAVPEDAPPLTHLRGWYARGDLVERLRGRGLRAEAAVIYEQEARPLDDAARALLDCGVPILAPLYSPRTARLLAAGAGSAGRWLRAVCLSEAVARAGGFEIAGIAARPDGPAMEAAIFAAMARIGG